MSIILGERLVRGRIASIVAFAALLGAAQPAAAQFNEQGPKLVGTGPVGFAGQGWSVAVSADGNTAIVGGPEDNTNVGAAWVYTRSGGVWTQQGSKLTAIDAVGAANQGNAVALSADGNTAIVGGYSDNSSAGAAWIFTRSGGVWTQQGAKLVGTGAAGTQSLQGYAVALSADGNTALVGGPHDSSGVIGVPQGIGAAWVYTRSGGVWTQQGAKLIGSGAAPGNLAAEQGWSVALSADGNTALVGGPDDNPNGQGASVGATWVFTRSGGAWTQQGAKLIGTGAIGDANQGWSVALSGDGNTAIVGGPVDNTDGNNDSIGAAWIYTQSGGVWTQQGAKLVGSGVSSAADQGWSVALSADGNTALVGGFAFQPSGAAWVFTRSGGLWTQQGANLVASDGSFAEQGWSVALSGDGNTALVGGKLDNFGRGAAYVFVQFLNTLTATPASGAAPLAVTFKTFIAQGDTSTYTVSFGDGTSSGAMAISPSGIACVVSGPCYTGVASTTHSYTSVGNYTANLVSSANGSVATTMVVVAGPSASNWRHIYPEAAMRPIPLPASGRAR